MQLHAFGWQNLNLANGLVTLSEAKAYKVFGEIVYHGGKTSNALPTTAFSSL